MNNIEAFKELNCNIIVVVIVTHRKTSASKKVPHHMMDLTVKHLHQAHR